MKYVPMVPILLTTILLPSATLARTATPAVTTTAAASGAASPTAAASSPFDGAWDVILTCPDAQGALGYTYRFGAHVASGTLHGERGLAQTAGFYTLDGRLKADGTATLAASGLTGSAEYSVGHVPKLTPYNYHMTAHFAGDRGTATRDELRPCTAQFSKT